MSDPQINAILAIVQRIDKSVKQLGEDVRALQEAAPASEQPGASVPPSQAMHTQLLDHLAVLGDAIGRIHTRVTSDEPLSDTILEHPVMRRFIDSYPEGIPLPFDKAKRERMIAAFPTWDDARLADFLERGRVLLADPDTPNRERFGARTYLPHLERAIAEKQREPDREGPDRER